MIRILSAADYPSVLDVWRRAGLGTIRPEGRDDPEAFARQIESGRQTVWGADRDGDLVGVVVATHDGRKGWINRLAVVPERRRQGIAGRLLEAAEAELQRQGIQVIGALVERQNDASLAFFERKGYARARDVLYLSKRDGPRA